MYDVYVTVGDTDYPKVDSMLTAIQLGMLPDREVTYANGHGTYDGQREYSGVLLYLGLSQERADHLRQLAQFTGWCHGQEAVGVAVIPANSALVYCNLGG
jgi:hypothetical protein